MSNHQNFIILHDREGYYLFERLGKKVFSAYNKSKSLKTADSLIEILEKSQIEKPKNSESLKNDFLGKSLPSRFEIEESPYEVVFNDE